MARIGIIGVSGFVGSRLGALARSSGHEVVGFSRSVRPGCRVFPAMGLPDISGLDAVINLAGEPVLGIWTREKRRRIRESRIEVTRRVVESVVAAGRPVTLVNASAIGFYGDTGESEVDEGSPAGVGFLAETCVAWESETQAATLAGQRVVCVRIGFVIGHGGAMRLVLPLFRAGLGGPLGNGRQWMSCVHVDDVAGLMLRAVEDAAMTGPVNAVMPRAVRNIEFTKALARLLWRPAVIPAPAFALRFGLGGVSSILLDSIRVVPRAAERLGYEFRYVDAEAALQSLLTPK